MSATAATTLPKPNSAAFKKLLKELRSRMDLPSLVVIAEATLEQAELENILNKMMRGRGGHVGKLPKEILIAQVAKSFFASKDSAHSAVRILDKKTKAERNMVASVEASDLAEHLAKMDALIFPNERAKMIWALFRDGRSTHVEAAKALVAETLEKLNAEQNIDQTVHKPEQAEKLLAHMKTTEAHLLKKKQVAEKLENEKVALENERASLIVRLGQKEIQLKRLKEDLINAKQTLSKNQSHVAELERKLTQPAVVQSLELQESYDALKDQFEHLKRKVARVDSGNSEQSAIEELHQQVLSGARDVKRLQRENERLQEKLSREIASAKERTTDLRASLKKARQIAQDVKEAKIQKEGVQTLERVGVFIDAANLSASAARVHGGTFDFVELLDRFRKGQKPSKAVAYVVKQKNASAAQEKSFEGFVKALRFGGYEVRQKTPRQRKDGTVKADWDLGIAIDAVEMQNQFDVFVLGSGDGDFLPLVQYLKKRKKKVWVAAFRHSASEPLLRAADEIILFDDEASEEADA